MSESRFLLLSRLVKQFGHFTALDDISLSVRRGEFICFLGPSGCGKTTLLRAIAGLDLPTRGQVWQAGRDITRLPPEQRDFGIVFQSYALFPNLTVFDNIAFGLRNQGLSTSEINARVRHWLTLIDQQDAGEKYPAQLSGGQQQRVALARTLALSPGLLLLDEPLSALDTRVRSHLRGELKALQRELGITTIMVTHDQEEALTLADRIVVMNQGRIEQVGSPEAVYCRPNSPFVAGFIGSINLITVAGEQIAIRPEHVRVQPLHSPGTGPNANSGHSPPYQARLSQTEFLGHLVRLTLQADTPVGQQIIHSELPLTGVQRLQLQCGQRCVIDWRAEHICHFPASETEQHRISKQSSKSAEAV